MNYHNNNKVTQVDIVTGDILDEMTVPLDPRTLGLQMVASFIDNESLFNLT